MTDRELLESAAKAAGIKALRDPHRVLRNCTGGDPAMNIFAAPPWNPLEDDGDALRLAVKLRLDVKCYASLCEVFYGSPRTMIRENGGSFKATRRAIVRAAAAMGAAMTADEVERLAREAGLHRAGNLWYSLETGSNRENADVAHEDLARFAELVQAQERERCAKVCDGFAESSQYKTQRNLAMWCASDIRKPS